MAHPRSDVSGATGIIGLLTILVLVVIFKLSDASLGSAIVLLPLGLALSMIVWALAVEKVHLRESTGLDFSLARPWSEIKSIVHVKIIGFLAALLLISLSYWALRTYQERHYDLYLSIVPITFAISVAMAPFYIWFTTRHMVDPKDDLWHFGKLLCLDGASVDLPKVKNYLRGWAIKGFFLAFVASIYPGMAADILRLDLDKALSNPVSFAITATKFLFLIDVCFGGIGYILTFRILDSHIRSANPHLAAWVAAAICYPPFILLGKGGPLDYRLGTQEWHVWLAGWDALIYVWTFAIIVLAAVYAWSTAIFGIRFSNLTNRGIITNGPYYYFKHPAYLSKNVYWWMVCLPFLSVIGPGEALRNCIILLIVNAIYFARAKTEEMHLMADPRYQVYSVWIAQNGLARRFISRWRAGPTLGLEQRPASPAT